MYSDTAPAPQEKSLVLISGGVDSATALAIARANTCEKVFTLSFNYGQKQKIELNYAEQLASYYDVHHRELYLGHAMDGLKGPVHDNSVAQLHRETLNMLPPTWKPGRNIVFLALASGFAWYYGCSVIVIGAHQEDYPGYPDCTLPFLANMEYAICTGTNNIIELWAPLLKMNKTEIVKTGMKLDVPYNITYSCYEGAETHCGECDACKRRIRAFKEAGWKP